MPSLPNLTSLSPEALQNDAAQLEELQKIRWALNGANADQIILLLASKPSLLEYILAASHHISTFTVNHVLAGFPSTAEAFASSLGGTLLRQLWSYLFSVRRVLPPGTQMKLDTFHLKVDKIPTILTSLSDAKHLFGSQVASRKKAKIGVAIKNPEIFRTLGISLPSSAQQVEGLITTLLQEQKEILKEYLDVLRDASLAHIFRTEYFSHVQINSSNSKSVDTIEEPQPTGTSALHSAHPAVQPMKAALFFESAAGFGDWRLLLSTRATKDLREARRGDQALLKIIVKKMKELSNGNFSDDNQKRLNGSSSEVPIYEAKMTRDQRLVYQVDCVPEHNSSSERQVLRIFGIYNHTQIDRLWQSLGIQLATKGKEYRRRCIYRKPHYPGDKVFVPGTFPLMEVLQDKPSQSALDLPHEDLDTLHSLLVLEKFVVFSQALLNSIVADKDVEHIFDVSPREWEIIQHPSSCYVIGRSGTGKTTTMLFKMFHVENGSTMLGNKDSPKPRQLFVTQSRMLAGKVEEYFAKLMDALVTARYSLEELAILAKSHREDAGLVDLDDQVNWRNDLPGRFSELQDEHFPLFITFDRLCGLLEADFMNVHRTTGDDLLNRALGEQNEGAMVSYDLFRDTYWDRFPQHLTKGLDPSLVFSEIMGVIKGSEAALNSPDRFIRKNDYINLSHRTQSTFALQRGTIYDIFEVYMKHKHNASHRDSADRTHAILNALAARLVPRNRVDYIYVDEVQDNLLIDAQLLRYLCRNRNGLFWAGDTAQTISVGSSFRFDDLKAFLFRVEEHNASTTGVSATVIHPQTFQLAVNYRSHAGIVNTAHTLISLITSFWPHAIDTLAQETGLVDGLKPVFFHGWNAGTIRYEQFIFGASAGHIEFGAQQCILVRNDRARNQLRDEVGDIGLIMTLYESKGLEFNDVLLYNFFENSTANLSQWRVVLNALPPMSLGVPAPQFNDTRHAAICSELKSLYVAITRARKNVWIVDCSDKGEPMRMVWESKNQVHSFAPGADIPQLAVSSTLEEWAAAGEKLFQHKKYIQAIHCFERANMFREVDVAKAYSLRAQARAIPINQDVRRKTTFAHVAEAFLPCAAATKKTNERRTYYTIAGDCFIILVAYRRAAEAYLAGEAFTKAAISYRKAGNFQEAVKVIKQHWRDMDADVVNSIMDVARLDCFRDPDIQESQIISQTKELFEGDMKQAMIFFSEYGFDSARATLLVELGDPVEAARIYFGAGQLDDGIKVLLEHKGSTPCAEFAAKCTIEAFWKSLSFGVDVNDVADKNALKQWRKVAGQLDSSILSQRELSEIAMFNAIFQEDTNRLQQLGLEFWKEKHKHAALLCLDHIFANTPSLQGLSAGETVNTLEMFFSYAALLRDIACFKDPCGNEQIRKLFAFVELREDVFALAPGSTLHREVAKQQMFFQDKDGYRTVSRNDVSRVLRRYLTDRLQQRVLKENKTCRAAKSLQPPAYPCIDALSGACRMPGCQHAHIKPEDIPLSWYQNRVRAHLLQIQIYQTLHFVDLGPEAHREDEQRYWLGRLYAEINPDLYVFGCRESLDLSVIPGNEKALMIVLNWAKDMIYTADANAPTFLTDFLQAALLGLGQDPQGILEAIRQAPYLAHDFQPPPKLKRPLRYHRDGFYVMYDLARYLDKSDPLCLKFGVIFVRHLVTTMVPMRTSIACEMFEHLCTAFVVLMHPSLHGVTLPRSWLFKLLRNGHPRGDKRLHSELIDPILNLIGKLHASLDTEKLPKIDDPFGMLTVASRQMYIFRLCRSLCLLGQNLNNSALRDRIGFGLAYFNRRGMQQPELYRRYFEANHWPHLSQAACDSMNGSPMDEIVQLYQKNLRHHISTPRGARRIVFSQAGDVPALLDIFNKPIFTTSGPTSETKMGPIASTLKHPPIANQDTTESHPECQEQSQAAADIIRRVVSPLADPQTSSQDGDFSTVATVFSTDDHPQSDSLIQINPGAEDAELREENAPEEETDEPQMDLTVDADALAQSLQDTGGQVVSNAPTEEQIHAALRIQTAYHRLLRNRRTSARVGLSAARHRHFLKCWLESEKMDWPRGGFCLSPPRYRVIFLGPIPHLLVCLERARTVAWEDALKAKTRVATANHEDLEDVQKKVKTANDMVQKVCQLEEALGAQGVVHRSRDYTTLKQLVCDAIDLTRTLSCARQVGEDLSLVAKAIIQQRRQPARKQKPALNMEHDDGYEYL